MRSKIARSRKNVYRGSVVRIQHDDYGDSWKDISQRVLERDGYCCKDCGISVKGTRFRAVHHIIPLSKGGRTVMNNLKTQCDTCHGKKHGHLKPVSEAAKEQESEARRARATWSKQAFHRRRAYRI